MSTLDLAKSLIVEPEVVAAERKQKEKQHQLERRGIARDLLPALIQQAKNPVTDLLVSDALTLADELLSKTKVEP